MSFIPFDLERWQSVWEHRVRFNLAESGVHPMSTQDLLALVGTDIRALADVRLGYSQSDGTDQLRDAIASLYPGATESNVLVTTGSSEANFITCWSLIEPGDRVAILTPTYRQTWGLAQNFGADVATFDLHPELGWEPDPVEIAKAIRPGTKLVVVTNPNNPTGHVLSRTARAAIVERVQQAGAWLLADEVYLGAELSGDTTESLWGSYDRIIAVNGLSKAYALPGLRIGWIVAPPELKELVYARHDYTVICPAALSDYLARLTLAHRDDVLSRTRAILDENWSVADAWLRGFGDAIEWTKPDCGAITFLRYRAEVDDLDLVDRIRAQEGILLVPGDHFGWPRWLRLGYGNELAELKEALGALEAPLKGLLLD